MRGALSRFCFSIILVFFAGWRSAGGATLTGVLYGDQGGVSGTASGDIRLAVSGKVYHLAYQKPYPSIDSSQQCRFAGSIWTVEAAKITDDGNGDLISAQCKGDG